MRDSYGNQIAYLVGGPSDGDVVALMPNTPSFHVVEWRNRFEFLRAAPGTPVACDFRERVYRPAHSDALFWYCE